MSYLIVPPPYYLYILSICMTVLRLSAIFFATELFVLLLLIYCFIIFLLMLGVVIEILEVIRTRKRKRKRSDSVLWQKPLHKQKCQKGKVTTQKTPQKSSIKQRLRTDLGRSVGVTKAIQLVWLTGLRAHLPTNRNSRLIKRTHI